MALNFKDLKRGSATSFQKLQQEVANLNKFKNEQDDRFWQPTIDKNGNGGAVIRFLPAAEGEEIPFVRLFSHGFKGPTGKWYIENSRTTIGEKDPVSEQNSALWNSTTDDDAPARKLARDHKRRLSYISNIRVIRDTNTENEGKVFLFRYGVKIWDKINTLMHPDEALGDEPVNPFDLWTGANFRMRICKVSGFRNYDKSSFESPSPLSDDDDELAKIWAECYPLLPLIAADQFKSYEELEKKLRDVVGNSVDLLVGNASAAPSAPSAPSKPARTAVADVTEDKTDNDPPWGEDESNEPVAEEATSGGDSVEDYFKDLDL